VAALCFHEDLVYSAEVRPGHPSFADSANRGRGMFFIFAQYRLEMSILSERAKFPIENLFVGKGIYKI
jgi:hypothetical protein